MKRLVAAGAIVAASLVSAGATVSATSAPMYPPEPPDITLNISITIIVIGGTVNLTFIGCQIGENVGINIGANSTFTMCSGSGGGASRIMQAPELGGSARSSISAPMEPGEYLVTATGLTSGYTASQRLTVRPTPEGIATMSPGPTPQGSSATATPAASGSRATATRSTSTKPRTTRSTSRATPRRAQLPATGSNDVQMAWIAGSTLLVGVGLVGASKRRRRPVGA